MTTPLILAATLPLALLAAAALGSLASWWPWWRPVGDNEREVG